MSRRRLTEQLKARGEELQAERYRFALESVRYERAKIARELHHIIAHCVSVMVVQAGAGQRPPGTDNDGTAAALTPAASRQRTESYKKGLPTHSSMRPAHPSKSPYAGSLAHRRGGSGVV